MDFINNLNESQREAVTYSEGPQLVIAGAGSGKTRVLTYKIAYLLEQGVPANHILALTFTNKAAREMKERIGALVGPENARYLWMGTFHSICARILRNEAEQLGYSRHFSIYDTPDMKSLVKSVCKDKQLDEKIYKPGAVLAKISAAKNILITPEEYALRADFNKRDRIDRMYEMSEVYRTYQQRLKAANAMDFDDLLMNICVLFHRYPEALHYYQDIFQYVLVDEYQDTNYAQYLIVKQLAEPQNNVCVVGDDAQSIYSFRGADIRNILSFQQGYPNAKLFKLERNYRSTQTIVNAANSLIHHNENQIFKNVFSEKEVGGRIGVYAYMSDREEASGVAALIKSEEACNRDLTFDDIAVLYRTNAQSRVLENELRHLGIPYRIYGGTSFYQRKEIKDAIGYFRLASNPKDNEALLRVINYPARGIGDTTLRKVSDFAVANNLSMFEVVQNPADAGFSAATAKRLTDFASMMAHFIEVMETKDAYEFAETVMRQSGILTAAALDRSQEGIDRKQNLDELLSGIHEFVQQRIDEGIAFTPIQDFLAEVSLLTDQDENIQDHTARVTLMTVHAAKGLEFASVHIVGLEEQLFPSQFCQSPAEIEEERRLLYVAITRAMQTCTLSFARSRFTNGTINFSSQSRFLKDIDRQYLQLNQTGLSAPRGQYGNVNSVATVVPRMGRGTLEGDLGRSSVAEGVTRPKQESPITNSDWNSGDRISHRVFGKGTILRVYRDEATGNDKIDINFDEKGQKTLLLTYAKLERLS